MPEFTFATEPKVVVTALRPILLPIYEAFEIAVPKVHKMILDNAWPKTGHFQFAHSTRRSVGTSPREELSG